MNPLSPSSDYAHIPSPCVGVCRMDAADRWCVGCLRSREEIGQWSQMTDRQKFVLWTRLTNERSRPTTPLTAPESEA